VRLVDAWVEVSEAEIAAAMLLLLDTHHKLVEGAAGVALAAFLQTRAQYQGLTVAIVLCGSNVGSSTVTDLLLAARPAA
jgi:threonine dehydratase